LTSLCNADFAANRLHLTQVPWHNRDVIITTQARCEIRIIRCEKSSGLD